MFATLPRLVRLYIRSVAIGYLAAAVFTALILWFDVVGLGGLILRSPDGWLAGFLLWFFNGIVFSGVQTVWALMAMAEEE
jgi:hypothetical protein